MTKIDDGYYYFDLEKINEYLFEKSEDENEVTQQDTMDADGNIVETNLVVKAGDEKVTNIKYDVIKVFLEAIMNAGIESEDGAIKYSQTFEELSIGSKLAFNTFFENEFIKNKL